MEEQKAQCYKYCVVPMCSNTTVTTSNKFFFSVPRHEDVRKKWCKLMRRDQFKSSQSRLNSCEDHFTAYCISIVWRCYKYLTLRQENARSTVHYILRGDEADRVPDPEYLLPDYEAACASFKQPPPPSYQAAMEHPSPPAYPEATSGNPRYGFIITQSIIEPTANENNNTVSIACVNETLHTTQNYVNEDVSNTPPQNTDNLEEEGATANQIECNETDNPSSNDGLNPLIVKEENENDKEDSANAKEDTEEAVECPLKEKKDQQEE